MKNDYFERNLVHEINILTLQNQQKPIKKLTIYDVPDARITIKQKRIQL